MVEDAPKERQNITTRLTRLWDIDVPIIGAPMAGRAGGELAAAVSQAGGLGMIGVGANTSAEWVTENARIAREATQSTGGQAGSGAQDNARGSFARRMMGQKGSTGSAGGPAGSAGATDLGNFGIGVMLWSIKDLSLIHISEPTRRLRGSRMPSSA